MGMTESKRQWLNERFENECRTVRLPTLVFRGYLDAEQMFLDNKGTICDENKFMLSIINWLIGKADLGTTSTVLTKLVNFLSKQYSIETALLNMKIERAVATSAASFVTAEIEGVDRQLRFLSGTGLSETERISHLTLADAECFKILTKLNDDSFYLKRYALASAPVLVNFICLYVPIAIANYRMTSSATKRTEIESNMIQLKAVLEFYETRAVQERKDFVKCHRDYSRTRSNTPVVDHYYAGGAYGYPNDRLRQRIPEHVGKTVYTDVFELGCLDIADEIRDYYNDKLKDLYHVYFAASADCISQFYSSANYT